MKKIRPYIKKISAAAILLVIILGVSLPLARVHAQADSAPTLNWLNCAPFIGDPPTCALYVLTLFTTTVMGFFLAIAAWLTQLALTITSGVINIPVVQQGFSVTLAVANLGFVVAIIVIAIATILRSSNYGMKQMLWKLVVAAILVNFSLVICGVILNFSDTLTKYFINAATGGGGNFGQFVTNLTDGFAPQALFQDPLHSGGTGLGDGFIDMMNMLFIIIFLSIVIFTFLAIAVMLLIRYVMMGFLLILMPLAWLLWIFPDFKSNWTKWWRNFIRWAFFPPITVFFLYLALFTAQTKSNGYLWDVAQNTTGAGNSAVGTIMSLAGFQTASGTNPVAVGAQMIIVIGLSLGGLFMANSLSITGASVAMGAVKSVGNAAQGYVGRQGKKVISRAVPQNVKNKLQQGGYRVLPKKAQMYIGIGLSKVQKAGGAELVDQAAKTARERAKNPEEAARLLAGGGLARQDEIALIKEMQNNEDLGYVKTVRGVDRDKYIAENAKMFKEDYGQVKFYDKDLRTSLMNPQAQPVAAAAAQNVHAAVPDTENVLGRGAGRMVGAMELLNETMKKLVLKQEKSDANKIDANHLFKTETLANPATETRVEAYLRKVAGYNYELVPGILNGLKAEQRKNFAEYYRKSIDKEKIYAQTMPTTTPEQQQEKQDVLNRLDEAEQRFGNMLLNNAFFAAGPGGAAGGAGPAGGAPAPGPAAPPPPATP